MRERSSTRAAFVLLALLHALACLHYFPPAEIFSGEPLLTGDYVQHYLESVHRADVLREGRVLPYCTTWAAGFVDGFAGLVSLKPYNLVVAALPPPLRPVGFNLTVFVALLLFPFLVHATARRLGLSPAEAAVAMALAIACWYGSMLFRVFWRAGSVIFPVATGASLWCAAILFARWSQDDDRPSLLLAAAAVAAVPWIHSGAVLIVAIAGGLAYLVTFPSRGLRARDVAVLSSVTLVANLPWIVPFAANADLRRSLDYGIYPGGWRNLVFDFFRGPLHLGPGPREETAILAPLVVLALLGAWKLRERRGLRIVLFGSAAVFGLLAYSGPGLGTAALQPYRFTIPIAAIASILAGPALRWRSEPEAKRRVLAAIVAAGAFVLVADRVRVARRAGDYLGAGLGVVETRALEALRRVASPDGGPVDGRVLLEGDWWVEPVPHRPESRRVSYSFVGFEGRIDAELVGAPTMAVLTHAEEASFWLGKLFGRRLDAYDLDSFLAVSEAYDLRWVVTLRPASRRVLERFAPEVELVAEADPAAVFRIHRARPRGEATWRSDGRRIEVVTRSAEPVVLPYHWNRLLAANPPAELRPVPTGVTPSLSFIELRPPRPGTYVIGIAPPAPPLPRRSADRGG